MEQLKRLRIFYMRDDIMDIQSELGRRDNGYTYCAGFIRG